MVETITLLKISFTVNAAGTQTAAVSARKTVFCIYKSVGMKEAYQAMTVERKPDIKAVLADYLDYDDEPYALVGNKQYAVLRTYRNGHELELTLERTRDLEGLI